MFQKSSLLGDIKCSLANHFSASTLLLLVSTFLKAFGRLRQPYVKFLGGIELAGLDYVSPVRVFSGLLLDLLNFCLPADTQVS